ncbi:hypothetical protein ACFOEK_13655 [Litoribrevibacter euphylliae]|uniref:Uncharacterized protein n=1 Tax=Litoribrevibacter euphylliae TaxID=1834034 RepID=A0ABV7HHG8_9GAMM
MYEIVTDQTQVPVLSAVEGEIEACYLPAGTATRKLASDSCLTPLLPSDSSVKSDQLRQYVTQSEEGYYLDIRFSHDEFDFINAMSKWLSRITTYDLQTYPDLAELVVREFRQGACMEDLPVTKIRSYAERWDASFWQTIQVYKKFSRDLHEHYQNSLKRWVCEQTL